ncbi:MULTISPECIES: ornithine cyclodeaminase [unclassified Haematospirillum]|uniref:ornithine cyclodeaminase n=1 Tax=unclassified Haematospirillum TaxID=2622088 RepID=UPI0014391BC7|nr:MULTISPECIES: ornithine cyclodeaminase [unclassified Haematospirillum]NKD55904.1 ornithine cyclodeaminase [Haematospirillum sp. H4890]NKD75964.1 ornithine cyclodeaminase [Haematospirillum sp. H4485]NKD88608.1 ornithine cyclodeaminase [Haematospirillum sp. 15-248]
MLKNITPARTLFLSVEGVAAIMKKKGAAACIEGIAQYINEDFLRWEDFDKTARVASHSDDGVIELMPIADKETYTFKYVNGHPRNSRFGLSTVMAFGVLSDVETGAPELLSELTLTTAMRTAAMSAVAAKALAKPEPKSMALIGNGAQSEFQALAFSHLLGVKCFHLYDIDPYATAKLQRNLEQLGLESQAFSSTHDAVRGTDIVTTVTADKTKATIIAPDMIEPGMHINGVGGDCPGKTELHCDVLRNARVFVEYEPQSRIEGDVQQMPPDFPVTEIWRVLAGHALGRQSPDDVTIFDSVGFALEDFSALRFMRDVATTLDLCESISLVPALENPRNLFGFAYEKSAGQTHPLRDVVAY